MVLRKKKRPSDHQLVRELRGSIDYTNQLRKDILDMQSEIDRQHITITSLTEASFHARLVQEWRKATHLPPVITPEERCSVGG